MKRVLYYVAGFAAIIGLAALVVPAQAFAATGSWQKSVAIQSRYAGDFGSSSFDQSVDKAMSNGVNTVVLIVALHQSSIYSTDVQTGSDTPTDAAISSAVKYVRGKGGRAVISIHLNPYDNQWRAMINPSDRASWFYNYGNQLMHYAYLAQTTGAQQMVLGTELSHMTSADFNQSNTTYWQSMIKNVRGVYSGALTYSAQHDGYMSDLAGIGFWGQLDYIGISAYYGMGYDNSVSALEAKWAQYDSQNIQPITARYGKSVLFTEIGYASKSNTLSDPGTAYQQGGGYDPTSQANAYQALFDYWSKSGYFAGVTLWDWSSDPSSGGNGNTDYTPQGKPAQDVMKQFFTTNVGSGGTSTGGNNGGGTTTTPAAPAASSYTLSGGNGMATTGTAVTTNVSAAANGSANNMLVDIEIYDSSGNRVAQKYFPDQSLSTTPANYAVTWTPASSGTYSVKGGIFTANWASNVTWNNTISTVQVANPATSTPPVTTAPPATNPTPPATTPTPPTPAPPTTTPNPPASTPTPPANANVSIWWPSNGTTVNGVQPFKAVLDGADLKSYTMYWQVDGGALNQMNDTATDGAHKEAAVNVSGWNWQPSHNYVVNFVAKNASGAVIAQKSTTITVSN